MLSVAKLSGNLDYYLELATLEYYQNGGEPVGTWFGKGAERLNLSGEIDQEVIRRIASGYSADGKRKLVQNAGKEDRQIGWDLTFSAPKSVSVLWSVAGERERMQVQAAQQAAVEAAITYLEETSGVSRVGKQGRERKEAGLVVGLFEHGSSRANDPQLHTHALVLNVGVDSEGKTRSIVSKPLFQQKMTAGALYRTELAHQLVTRLGVRLESAGFAFKIKGVPDSLCDFHSKRRKEVLQALKAAGQASARAAHIATLETRDQKTTLPRYQLLQKWRDEAVSFSFSEESVKRIMGHRPVRQRPVTAVDGGFRKLVTQHSYFSHSELVRETALRSQVEGISMNRVLRTVRQFLELDQRVHRVTKIHSTSKKNYGDEVGMLQSAACLFNKRGFRIKTRQLEGKLLDPSNASLNWEQSAAIAHITLGDEAIALVSGKAGTGKTQMLKTAAELWQEAGHDVFGICVAGKAARGLHEATGIRTETVAKFLYDASKIDEPLGSRETPRRICSSHQRETQVRSQASPISSKGILIIDEAAMLGTEQMGRVLLEAQRTGMKVVLVGDANQLQPIDPGNPFHALAERIGAIRMDEVRRQQDAFDRQMVADLSEGSVHDALTNLAERDLVHCADDRASAIRQLVADWGSSQDRSSLILVPSKAEAREVNGQCQKLRQSIGEVKNGIGLKVNGQRVQAGDRIQFTQRNRSMRLENGDFGVVEHVNPVQQTITVRLDSGRKVLIPTRAYDSIQLGYATTVHKGQGITVDRAFVLLGGYQQDRHLSYVQLSRARAETRVYVDRFEAGQNYGELLSLMERRRQRPLAFDLAKINEALSQSH